MFLNSLKKMFDNDNEINRYYSIQYQSKLDEITSSFDKLKSTTASVIKNAVSVTDQLKQRVELYEKRFDAIVNNVNDMIMIKTINRQWAIVNDFTCNLLGIDREMCIGKTNNEITKIYPNLSTLLSTIDNCEHQSWVSKQPNTITVSIDVENKPVNFDIIIKPIETSDEQAHEIVVVGKVSGK